MAVKESEGSMTLDEFINHIKGLYKQINHGEEVLKYLEELKELQVELEVLRKAYGLMSKDYCESMGCAFCDHHAKCLEANHFKNLEGKDFLQAMFINEVYINEKS